MPDFNLRLAWAAALCSVLLVACGGGGDGTHPAAQASADPTVEVAPAAATDASVAASYTASLASTPDASTDVLEPVRVPAQLAVDDTAEPGPVMR